ncbi:MAG TPA: hypothetical protein VLA14_02180 [Polyangia bacterium]|jgi:hypothetical protein|nr:hypothetical protein [Polyangia bacterium]
MSRAWPLVSTLGLALVALACRPHPLTLSPSTGPDDRDVLLELIHGLRDVEPCLVDAGVAPIRVVEARLAGDVAMMRFACANGAAAGKVTFFRLAGTWTVSTKYIDVGDAGAPDAQ